MRVAAIAVVLLAVLAQTGQARAEECEGLTVAAVEWVGCDAGKCSSDEMKARLAKLTDLLGNSWTSKKAGLAEQRLMQTGYFRGVSSYCRAVSSSDAKIVFELIPNRYIRKTRITGTKVVFATDLEKRIFLNTGARFNPGDKESAQRLDRQLATLTSFVRQEGFDTATVTAEVTEVDPDQVDISIRVEEGEVSRVGKITVNLEGPWNEADPPAFSCPRIVERDIARIIEVRRGDLYTSTTSRAVKRETRYFLQQYGFQSPRIKIEFDVETGELAINVKISTCFSILIYERQEAQPYHQGFELTDEPELYESLSFRESGVFDPREARFGIEDLLVHYRNRGFLFADVELQYVDYRNMVSGWPYSLVGGVIYRVSKEQPAEIREISFTGANAFAEETLKSLIETRRYDFFDTGGYLQVERLFSDLDVMKNYYYRHGYFKMKYTNARGLDERTRVQLIRRGDVTIYRYHFMDKSFDVVKPDWENAVRIEIAIDEGEGTRVREIRVVGTHAIEAAKLQDQLPVTPGGPFSAQLVKSAVNEMESRYHKLGRSVQVDVKCAGIDPLVPPGECKLSEVRSRRVDLEFRVREGARHFMGEVFVVGDLKTRRNAIVREFPDEGEPFDKEKIDRAARQLRNLGIFSSVRVTTVGLDEAPPREKVAIVVHVEEAQTKFAEISAGFQKMAERGEEKAGGDETLMADAIGDILTTSVTSTGSSLTGSASAQTIYFPDVLLLVDFSYTDRNFMGSGKDLVLPLKYGFSTRDPLRYAAFTPTYMDRRFLATDLTLRLTPLIVYDMALRYMDEFEYGLEAELSYSILKFTYLGLKAKVSRIAWKRPDEPEFEPQELQISVTPQVRFDWRDSPINPTSGASLAGKVTYLNALVDKEIEGVVSDKIRDNFLKYEVQGQFYLSFRKTVILATNLRFGDSFSLGESESHLPATHKFYLGGTSGVRGFPARGVLQYDRKGYPLVEERALKGSDGTEFVVKEGGDTLLNGSVELRFPILRSTGLWAAAFLDVGALSDGPGNLNGQSFRFSVGLGVRWLIGDQIPVRLDYGFVLDRRFNGVDPTDGKFVTTDDLGAIDFGLLYTF